jgi:hypothetical protein
MKRGFKKLANFPLDEKERADALAYEFSRQGLRHYTTVQRRGQIWMWVYTVNLGPAVRVLGEFRENPEPFLAYYRAEKARIAAKAAAES